MKHVSILIPHGSFSLVNVEGTYQILSQVNDMLRQAGGDSVFDVHLVGETRPEPLASGLFTVNPDSLLHEVTRTDLIIIPAIFGDPREVVEQNRAFIPWLLERREQGAEIASYCVGAFFLAATGLLSGRQCSTHWMHADEFRRLYPDVELVEDRIMTEADGIFTSGGAYSALNLLMYIVERYAGREAAVLASKAFMIDLDRQSQSPFIMFKTQRDHDDAVVRLVQEYIEEHYQQRLTVARLAARAGLVRRNLERRFRNATGNSVAEYVQRVKMEAAKRRLENTSGSIFDVMEEVGYTDLKAFRRAFRKTTALSPADYRSKYARRSVGR